MAFGGCIDLFHTTDLPTLCDLDATAQGCTPQADAMAPLPESEVDADADAAQPQDVMVEAARPPSNFCAWDRETARKNAEHACAWLGACAGPLGNNALGTCMSNALLAYDCRINPNRKVLGKLHDYWDCLWQAGTCDVVNRCVHPKGVESCTPSAADYFGCGGGGGPEFEENATVRIACSDAGVLLAQENCLAVGQTCVASTSQSCFGADSADAACAGLGCDGTHLRDCSEGQGDRGVDCALYGKGQCVEMGGAACAASEGSTCGAGGAVTCAGGVARGCPSGIEEKIDCASLFGLRAGDAGAACVATIVGNAWDVSRACTVTGATCTESCDGKLAHACVRNAPVTVDCASTGLQACKLVTSNAKSYATCVR